jgi:hypothetical protein
MAGHLVRYYFVQSLQALLQAMRVNTPVSFWRFPGSSVQENASRTGDEGSLSFGSRCLLRTIESSGSWKLNWRETDNKGGVG